MAHTIHWSNLGDQRDSCLILFGTSLSSSVECLAQLTVSRLVLNLKEARLARVPSGTAQHYGASCEFGKFGLWTFQTHPTWSRCFYSRFLRPGGSDLCTASVYKSDASPTAKTEVTDLSVTDDVDCQGPQRSATEIRLVSEGLVVAERLFFFSKYRLGLAFLRGSQCLHRNDPGTRLFVWPFVSFCLTWL